MVANRANPLDIAIATDIEKSLQCCALSAARSACKCISPDLRRLFMQFSQESIHVQGQLFRLMEEKGWWRSWPAGDTVADDLLSQLHIATAGLGGAFAQTGGSQPEL